MLKIHKNMAVNNRTMEVQTGDVKVAVQVRGMQIRCSHPACGCSKHHEGEMWDWTGCVEVLLDLQKEETLPEEMYSLHYVSAPSSAGAHNASWVTALILH